MFVGFNSHFTRFILYLKPLMNILLFTLFSILTHLLLMSPIFLKEQKEYNILFYLHSVVATYNFLLYFITIVIILLHLISKMDIWINILKINSIFGIIISFFSLLTGISWGVFSWGNIVFFDNKVYLILIILFVYLFIYFIYIKYNTNNNFILAIILISLPFWKLLSFWWNTYHQSFTISSIGAALPSSLFIYFLLLFYVLILIYVYWILMEIRNHIVKTKIKL